MKKIILELSQLFLQILLFIVKIHFKFQVYLFRNGREMRKKLLFLYDDDAKASAVPKTADRKRKKREGNKDPKLSEEGRTNKINKLKKKSKKKNKMKERENE